MGLPGVNLLVEVIVCSVSVYGIGVLSFCFASLLRSQDAIA